MFRYSLSQFSRGNESYKPDCYYGFLVSDFSSPSREREIEFEGKIFQGQDLIQINRITTGLQYSIILEALKIKGGNLRVR